MSPRGWVRRLLLICHCLVLTRQTFDGEKYLCTLYACRGTKRTDWAGALLLLFSPARCQIKRYAEVDAPPGANAADSQLASYDEIEPTLPSSSAVSNQPAYDVYSSSRSANAVSSQPAYDGYGSSSPTADPSANAVSSQPAYDGYGSSSPAADPSANAAVAPPNDAYDTYEMTAATTGGSGAGPALNYSSTDEGAKVYVRTSAPPVTVHCNGQWAQGDEAKKNDSPRFDSFYCPGTLRPTPALMPTPAAGWCCSRCT